MFDKQNEARMRLVRKCLQNAVQEPTYRHRSVRTAIFMLDLVVVRETALAILEEQVDPKPLKFVC